VTGPSALLLDKQNQGNEPKDEPANDHYGKCQDVRRVRRLNVETKHRQDQAPTDELRLHVRDRVKPDGQAIHFVDQQRVQGKAEGRHVGQPGQVIWKRG